MKKVTHFIFLIFVCSLILSKCGTQTDDEVTTDIARQAANFLNTSRCQDAIDVLEEHGRQNHHAFYLRILASAYACRAGFSEPDFYTNISNVSGTFSGLISSMVQFGTAVNSAPNDQSFLDLQTAIDILAFAGNVTQPTAEARAEKFITSDQSSINLQMLYMVLTQIGKYAYLYGNANPTNGEKGTGSVLNGNTNGDSNSCFLTYTDDDATTIIDSGVISTGPCDSGETGHTRLTEPNVSESVFLERSCQGVTLLNQFVDLIGSITITAGAELGSLGDLQTDVSALIETLCSSITGSSICSVYSQTQCETDFSTTTGKAEIEVYFAALWEVLFAND